MTNTNPESPRERWHHRVLERKLGLFALLTTVAVSIGGIVEITPMFSAKLGPETLAGVTPYTPLEVAGRDIYIREGCYLCHSQMVRPMRSELLRYGEWSRAGEYAYDHPFLLGSRRAGPDLMRVGGKYPDAWHFEHLRDPRSTSPGSIMPSYAWLLRYRIDPVDIQASVRALQKVGVPYTDVQIAEVPAQLKHQGDSIVANLRGMGIKTAPDREVVALIAYLQRLGTDGKRIFAAQSAQAQTADAATHGRTDAPSLASAGSGASARRRVSASVGARTGPGAAQ
jgi:cytochrome c oxidase cbb3-type subunit I/II